jgi:pimeloyl-ACP methyl ester carboxylesterase
MILDFASHFILIGNEKIHIRRIHKQGGAPVFFLHGSIEDGKVFYTNKGKGLAPYLAQKGLDCYVIDLPGRGLSTPRIDRHSHHDLVFYIEEVIPATLQFIRQVSSKEKISIVTHSWGGVNLLASIAIKNLTGIGALIFFGTKRRISISGFKKFMMIDLAWRAYGTILSGFFKYYPAKEGKLGSENETIESFIQTDQWVRSKQWLYFKDQIDIAALLQEIRLPPILSITGKRDEVLGNSVDVRLLLEETGKHQPHEFILAGKENGFRKDYGHINILTDPHAVEDIYPLVYNWIIKTNT